MKTRIPTWIGTAVLLFLTATVLLTWKEYSQPVYLSAVNEPRSSISIHPNTVAAQNGECKPRAFTGEVKIKGWYVDQDSQKVFQVAEEDMNQLPITPNQTQLGDSIGKIKIIDANSTVEKKLANSSQAKPLTITIKGFGVPCSGNNVFASLDYKDGIFKGPLGLNN